MRQSSYKRTLQHSCDWAMFLFKTTKLMMLVLNDLYFEVPLLALRVCVCVLCGLCECVGGFPGYFLYKPRWKELTILFIHVARMSIALSTPSQHTPCPHTHISYIVSAHDEYSSWVRSSSLGIQILPSSNWSQWLPVSTSTCFAHHKRLLFPFLVVYSMNSTVSHFNSMGDCLYWYTIALVATQWSSKFGSHATVGCTHLMYICFCHKKNFFWPGCTR